MISPNLPEPELLKAILEPLLEDFLYWFDRSRKLLENEDISFLSAQGKADLLHRLEQAQREVRATQMLVKATGTQAGVEMEVLMPWHKLLTECWQIAMRFRAQQTGSSERPDVS